MVDDDVVQPRAVPNPRAEDVGRNSANLRRKYRALWNATSDNNWIVGELRNNSSNGCLCSRVGVHGTVELVFFFWT